MNLAYRDVRHNLPRFVLTCVGLSLLLGIVITITGVYQGQVDDALRQVRAAHPDLWGGLLDISGNEYPGSEHVSHTVAELFGGDKAAFEAAMPTAQLAAHPGAYAGHPAVFTWGTEDPTFGPGQKRNADAARAAGFNVAAIPIAGAGHVGTALTGGLDAAIQALGPAIGLAPPG